MSYRPVSDTYILARAKLKGGVKYYGAYLGGFPERARRAIGARLDLPLLHVCGGMARLYPYKGGFGPNDRTLDLDPETKPDYLQNALDPWPEFAPCPAHSPKGCHCTPWAGVLIDPPYSEADAENYRVGAKNYPSPSKLLERAFEVLPEGGKVGIIHYFVPRPPKDAIFTFFASVICGFNNKVRAFSVFEKPFTTQKNGGEVLQ